MGILKKGLESLREQIDKLNMMSKLHLWEDILFEDYEITFHPFPPPFYKYYSDYKHCRVSKTYN